MTSRAAVRAGVSELDDAVRADGATDQGRVRDHNEDCFHVDAERGIFLVVDGVGGHAAGEVAATIARQIIVERLQQDMWSPAQRVREAIALANNEIVRRAAATPAYAGMTCVVTVALLQNGRLTVGHVGDSRLYAVTPQAIRKLTHDHSPIGEREDAGEISEADAMHHPRRNEVFRDVGSTQHEPDDPDFVELIEAAFAPQDALLVCSDGLSDMLTGAAIERTIRQHAGNPAAVTKALIDAANAAGGKDNVTVVYVEGPRFAAASATSALPTAAVPAAAASATPAGPPSLLRRIFASRVLWFTVGALAGIALAYGLQRYLEAQPALPVAESRRLVVGGSGPDHFPTITAALQAAGSRDIVEVEPGEYAEALTLPPGVQLIARVPGTVVLVAAPGQPDWVSVAADGPLGNRISGLRITGRPGAPIAIGLQLGGHELTVDDVTIEGQVETGMAIADDGTILVRANRFANVTGTAITIGSGSKPAIRQNVFTRATRGGPGIRVAAGAQPELRDNLFAGYSEIDAISTGATPRRAERELLRGNVVLSERIRVR